MYTLAYPTEREAMMAFDRTVAVVGCGGTGSLVAEGLCRLLQPNPDVRLLLVDHDRVDPHNLLRQAFFKGDVGRFKSEALAERLARLFDRPIGYSVQQFSRDSYNGSPLSRAGIIVGCVDNPMARAEIASSIRPPCWWVDAGNGDNWGQVLIGNARSPEQLRHAFDPAKETCWALPMPSVQRPELLLPATPATPALDCAGAVQGGEQSPTINQAMAALVLEVVHRITSRACPWMALYLDLQRGELKPGYATPANAARVFGLRKNQVIDNRR